MQKRLTLAIGFLLVFAFAVTPAMAQSAFTPFTAHVTSINVEGPDLFDFTTDNTPSQCTAAVLVYVAGGSDEPTLLVNSQQVYSALLAAEITGHSVTFYGNNPTSSFDYCTVTVVWANNQ